MSNLNAETAESAEHDPDEINRVSAEVVDAAIRVHSELGPGLLESVYETCLAFELSRRGFAVEHQKALPIRYDNLNLEAGYRIDLLVCGMVIVELKCVERFEPIHEAQLLTYLRLSNRKVGLLINFNVKRLRDGIKRMVYQL